MEIIYESVYIFDLLVYLYGYSIKDSMKDTKFKHIYKEYSSNCSLIFEGKSKVTKELL